jgi:hypothetical protein
MYVCLSVCLSEITFKDFVQQIYLKMKKNETLVILIHLEKIGPFDYLLYKHNFLTRQGNLTHYCDIDKL